MGIDGMSAAERRVVAPSGATVWQDGFRFAVATGGATWGFGARQRANRRADAERPAAAEAGRAREGGRGC